MLELCLTGILLVIKRMRQFSAYQVAVIHMLELHYGILRHVVVKFLAVIFHSIYHIFLKTILMRTHEKWGRWSAQREHIK